MAKSAVRDHAQSLGLAVAAKPDSQEICFVPDGRYADYKALRNALLPFSSREPEPASMLVRVTAGWIDFLLAFQTFINWLRGVSVDGFTTVILTTTLLGGLILIGGIAYYARFG